MTDTTRLDAELKNLQARGVNLPKNPARAAVTANSMHNMAKERGGLRSTVAGVQNLSKPTSETSKLVAETEALRRAMGNKRALSHRTAAGGGMGGDVMAAIPRFYDPLEYWDLSGLPWNMANEGHRHKLHKWLRLYYATHYLVPTLIDIFTRFPLVGMNLEVKDPALKKFYEELFFDKLDYGEFLVQLGREFWLAGEAFPLGSFDENLGVWEREELLNPEDIVIENFPLLGTQQLKIVPPDYLKKLVNEKSPAREYRQLELNFPELIPYLRKGEHIPISGVLLKQVANKLNSWDNHGTPILLRGLRTLLHEEKLMASQDAIAERLYSPLILAKLGIVDIGDGQGPWIPGPEELESVRDDFDMALASDFRLMVHHFGLDVTSVFGREQMPRLGDDFDRVERRLMQSFGVNPSLLSAGSSTQPYASSALQAEFLNQILRTFQNTLKKHFRERALVVAEAQGHWDYETKGQTRVPIFEEVECYDEHGEIYYEERHKLLVPDLDFSVLDLRDEATERQFLQTLQTIGVPLSDKRLAMGVNFDLDNEIDQHNDELKKKTIAQQQAKMDTYQTLQIKGLPIPADLKAEVESVLATPGDGAPPTGGDPGMTMPPGGPAPGGGAPGGPIVMPSPPGGLDGGGLGPGGAGGTVPGGGPPAVGPNNPQRGTVPEASNERRPGLTYNAPTSSTNDKVAATIDEPKDEWELEPNQELVEEDGNERIVIKAQRAASKKKYSIVDDPDEYPISDPKDASVD